MVIDFACVYVGLLLLLVLIGCFDNEYVNKFRLNTTLLLLNLLLINIANMIGYLFLT